MEAYGSCMDSRLGKLHYKWEEGGNVLYLGTSLQPLKNPGISGLNVTSRRHELLERELKRYLAGELKDFTVKTRLIFKPGFLREVLIALKGVGFGKTVSYKQLAELAGRPRAWRAAGSAMADNPLMILIPCHRVIKSSGQIGNFSAGPGIKPFLLEMESGAGG